ncbi:MAG: CoA-binding protein [Candidatus Spechtbacterales bacterium]
MAILLSQKTQVLVQGIAGREGSRAAGEMARYGTKVVAGVTPGKGGTVVEGVPVYDTVAQAVAKHPHINTSLIVIPAPAVKDATLEAIASGIPLINILSEHVPTQDCAVIVAHARAKGICVVGPSSVGIIVPGVGKLGSIGSGGIDTVFKKGNIGLISKSGGMTAEIGVVLNRAGFGQSTAVGIGGDSLIGSDFVDLLELFEKDNQTEATVIFGEVGGAYEERVAQYVAEGKIKKPVIAVIAGQFASSLAEGTTLGHAGNIVLGGKGSYQSKVSALKKAGIPVAKTLEELPALVAQALAKR